HNTTQHNTTQHNTLLNKNQSYVALANKKEYMYIVQSSLEPDKCRIGITDNLERKLKEYNSITGKSEDNIYSFLFICEVKNMRKIEADIKNQFSCLRELSRNEIYFYNTILFDMYVDFIKSHPLFIKEIFIKPKEKKTVIKIIKNYSYTS
ncbi:GIY-YIG nuclease family protein, partial [uncultured Brachyspira sp.]